MKVKLDRNICKPKQSVPADSGHIYPHPVPATGWPGIKPGIIHGCCFAVLPVPLVYRKEAGRQMPPIRTGNISVISVLFHITPGPLCFVTGYRLFNQVPEIMAVTDEQANLQIIFHPPFMDIISSRRISRG